MDRTEFTIFISFLLFSAFLIGWICCWIYHMLTRGSAADKESLKRISAELAIAQAERDQAMHQARQYAAEVDAKLEATMGKYHATLNQLRDVKDALQRQRVRNS